MVRLTHALIRKYNPAIATLSINLAIVDERKLKFTADLEVNAPNANGDGNSIQQVQIADPSGKVRVWPDIDSLLRAVAKETYSATGIDFSAPTLTLVPKYPDTYTPAQIAQKQHGMMVNALPAQAKRVTVATAALAAVAAFQNGTPAQQGVWAEKKAQLDTATAHQAFLIAERDRLAALFTPAVQ